MAGPWYIMVGGSKIDIDVTYGTKTGGAVGFGMPPLRHNVSEQALLPGALLQGLKVLPRVLQLEITCWAKTLAAYHSIRKSLLAAVKPNVGGTLAPVEIRYDGAGTELACFGYYDGGLEGNRIEGGDPPEKLLVRFICYDPFWYATSATNTTLTSVASIANANYIVKRISGVWANISSGFNSAVYAIEEATGNNVYIGGSFTDVVNSNGDGIVKWVPSTTTLSVVSTGLGAGVCYALAKSPLSGYVYLGGDFTNIGDANGDRVVQWSGSAWSSLGTGIDNGTVVALAVGLDGTLYAGGSFTNFVDANGDYITKWDGSAWSSLGSGLNGQAYAMAIGHDGYLYVGGVFTTAGGNAAVGIAKWDGSAWSAVGSGTGVAGSTADVSAVRFAPDGTLYIGGGFTSVDGVSANNIAKWNGQTWSALGSGCDLAVLDIAITTDGTVYAVGNQTTAGGLTVDRIAMWNGSVWLPMDIDLPGSVIVSAVRAVGNDLYVGYGTSGTAYAGAQTTVTNSGNAPAYPHLHIKRVGGTSAVVQYLKNETTGQKLYMNYALLDEETLTIDMDPSGKTITSDMFGNVIGRALLPNSDFAEWCLAPGANTVTLYVAESGSPTVTATMTHTNTYWSPDGAAS